MHKPYHKIFKNFELKKNFISFFNKSIFENIEIIAGKKVRDEVEKLGLEKMHKVFSVDYLPFLQFALNKKLKNTMYEFLFNVGKHDLNIKKSFFIDKTLNFRFNYPYKIKIRSKISRKIYRSINLDNYNNASKELNLAKKANYKYDNSDLTKIEYFKSTNNSLYLHSPHRDTWFAHSTKGLNLWLAISQVKDDNGMLLYPEVFKYNYQHDKNPAYIKDFYNLGKVYKPTLKSGELLIFNPEILHATHLNTGDSTRVVFSGRIEINKPKFYNKGFQIKEPYWIKSNDVMNKNYNNAIIIKREKENFIIDKKKLLKKQKIKKINFDYNFEKNNHYKIFSINKKINKKILLNFKNISIGILKKKKILYAFNALCPHLKINLLNSEIKKDTIICQGHGVEFDLNKEKSSCGHFNFKKYKIQKRDKYYYILAG